MKVKELIKELTQTGMDNEVRLVSSKKDAEWYTESIYVSFDDVGDVLLYDE